MTVTDDRYRAQMGKNNRARRAAKARSKARVKSKSRQQAQRRDRGGANGRPDGGAPGGAGNPFDEAYRVDPEGWTHGLLIEAAFASSGPSGAIDTNPISTPSRSPSSIGCRSMC